MEYVPLKRNKRNTFVKKKKGIHGFEMNHHFLLLI